MPSVGRRVLAMPLILSVIVCGTAIAAQFQLVEPEGSAPRLRNVAYDGRFTFARLRYTTGPGGFYHRGLPAWAHGYPTAEQNLMRIVNELGLIAPHIDESNVFTLDDPALSKFPIAYMTEAGFWTLTDKEATAFRSYLLKGGFVIFDDFRDDYRPEGGWRNFDLNMRRVLPEGRFVALAPSHPIFHSFFEIDSFGIVPQFYDEDRPVFRGLFEDNDPQKRLMAIANFNTDISHFWEFSATGVRPIDEANQAYKLGVNYIIYGLTH